MFDCARCKNTGQVTEQYTDRLLMQNGLPVMSPAEVMALPLTFEIKTRLRECPSCLGFSTVPLRRKHGYR